MRIFCSYAFTGEDQVVLQKRLSSLRSVFERCSVGYYINCFAPEWQSMMDCNVTGGEFLQLALKELKKCDKVLVIMASPRRSEGMLMEVGAAACLKKPIILAQHQSAVGQTYLTTVAEHTLTWNTDDELINKVKEYVDGQDKPH